MPKLSPLQSSKLALSIVVAHGTDACEAPNSAEAVRSVVGDEFLVRQGLGPLWSAVAPAPSSAAGTAPLRALRIEAAVRYLLQRSILAELDAIFEQAQVGYAVFKGAHVREWLYADPALRNPADIDALVRPTDRERAVRALIGAGYVPHADAATVSHELALIRHGVEVDLHWHVARPSRLRVELSDDMISRRQRVAGFWAVSNSDAVCLMLLHPAFTKYVSSPSTRLIRVVDFMYAVRDQQIDWPKVAAVLDRCGARTAGWAVLTWFQMLHPIARQVPDEFARSIAPGRVRAWYLWAWLRWDLPTRLHAFPWVIQAGFTLFFHDTVRDAWRAVRGILAARRGGATDPIQALAQSRSNEDC